MTPLEQRATFSLSLIVSLRMLGLMMVLPLFALGARQYSGASASLIGLAFGAYGLTQALLQIPLGMLSDRVGRKPVMVGGLLMLALGSIIAASGHSITHLLIGRTLQGGGAIGSTAIACLADLTQDENRNKAMAILGISIGVSFFLSMTLGPLLGAWLSLSGIFWCTALLAFIAIGVIYGYLPNTLNHPRGGKGNMAALKTILTHVPLLRLNMGVFLLHAISTASFIGIPLLLQQTLNLDAHEQWKIYLPILLLAFTIAFGLIVLAERKKLSTLVFVLSIGILCVSEGLFYRYSGSSTAVLSSLFLLLTVFSVLEAMLPSLASKTAPPESKGAAMGIFSSSQFLGIFAGGAMGGLIHQHYGINAVFLCCLLLTLIWLIIHLPSPCGQAEGRR